jgi:competence protein ComEA
MRFLVVVGVLAIPLAAGEAEGEKDGRTGLSRFEGCELVPANWADGDSFSVKFPDGKERTIRLYGVDCLEWHVTNETDARRLRAQRRYFGISEAGGSAEASIAVAKGLGEEAAIRVREVLGKPFTVHTAWADARGDGKHERYYGFVSTGAGRDLGEVLVEEGLARAFGVCRMAPYGSSRDDHRERLRDLELTAAIQKRGIWARTDWQKLPEERRAEREEAAELDAAKDGGKSGPIEKVDPNTAGRDELMSLPGIGEKRANAIIEGREDGRYEKPEDLDRVPGIGSGILEGIEEWLEFGEETEGK